MWPLRKSSYRQRTNDIEQAREARLTKAEGDLLTLKTRATHAITVLDERRQRNHWRESIEQMIQGV